MKGAPIRFLVAVVGGWTCVRIVMLLPDAERLAAAGNVLTPPAAAAGRVMVPVASTRYAALVAPGHGELPRGRTAEAGRTPNPATSSGLVAITATPAASVSTVMPSRRADPQMLVVPTSGVPSAGSAMRRWSASAWLLARGGSGGTLSGGQLGASQAGARVLYRFDERRRLALAGRIAAPLRGRGTEAAIGVDWQPTSAPVHLVAEQRFGIDGARGGPTLMAIAGLDPTPVVAGFRLEAYAQAGVILRDGKAQAFGDGALRLARPLASLGRARLDMGVGAWGAGQPGAKRVDVGPTLGLALPVANRHVRLSLDWRQRVAGDARPGSGPALSIGSDF